MRKIKPKDMADLIGVKPSQVTNLAKDIENANLYRFSKTPFGSFLFYEHEAELLKEYNMTFYFFKKKKIALEMIENRLEMLIKIEEEKPYWVGLLVNAVYVK